MLKLMIQSLSKRRAQTVSTMVSVGMGVAVLFALFLLYTGLTAGLESSRRRLGADLLVIPAAAEALIDQEELLFGGAPAAIYMAAGLAEEIAGRDGVAAASCQFFGQTLDAGCCSAVGATRLVGYDEGSDWLITSWLEEPVALGAGEILLGSQVGGFTPENAQVLGEKVTIKGILQPTGTSLDRSIIMALGEARRLTAENNSYGHIWAKYGQPETLVSAVLLKVEEGRKDEVAAGVMSLGGLRVIKAADVLTDIHDRMNFVFAVMLGAGLLLAAGSLLQLFARFFSLVWDRKGEWGLYRAIGASQRDLQALVVGEALLLTLGGVAAGLLLGAGLYALLLQALATYQALPFIAPGAGAALAGAGLLALLFAGLAVAAAALPANRSGRIDPSSAMALGDID